MEIAFLLLGIVLLMKGADLLVEGASSLARKLRVSHVVIGLTVVAFGTSLPELVVTLMSSLQGYTDMAVGNIVGSNIANIFLMLGICAVMRPLVVKRKTIFKEIPFMIFVSFLLLAVVSDVSLWGDSTNAISRFDGALFLFLFVVFLFWSVERGDQSFFEEEEQEGYRLSSGRAFFYLFLGLVGLFVGGRWIVDGAVALARMFGLSESVIGLTVTALGTSLPEVAASGMAVYRNKIGIAIGNAVGSNIFNILLVLGTNAVMLDLPFQDAMVKDLLIAIGAAIAVFVFALFQRRQLPLPWWKRLFHPEREFSLERWEGFVFLVAYGVYVWSLFTPQVMG